MLRMYVFYNLFNTDTHLKNETNKNASAGNRTRAARVAGEHSTTEPPMLTEVGGALTRSTCHTCQT